MLENMLFSWLVMSSRPGGAMIQLRWALRGQRFDFLIVKLAPA